jgi:hypothetical protein
MGRIGGRDIKCGNPEENYSQTENRMHDLQNWKQYF